jgi:hypothetical protein
VVVGVEDTEVTGEVVEPEVQVIMYYLTER